MGTWECEQAGLPETAFQDFSDENLNFRVRILQIRKKDSTHSNLRLKGELNLTSGDGFTGVTVKKYINQFIFFKETTRAPMGLLCKSQVIVGT